MKKTLAGEDERSIRADSSDSKSMGFCGVGFCIFSRAKVNLRLSLRYEKRHAVLPIVLYQNGTQRKPGGNVLPRQCCRAVKLHMHVQG